MFIYPVYKALKPHLTGISPVFFYTGQYAAGKNTNYISPVLYIELPRDANATFWGRGIRVIKNAVVKLHYLSNAPFHQHDNTVQDSALQAHHNTLIAINQIMQGLALRNEHGRLLTQQFIPVGVSELAFNNAHAISVLSYHTELYDYSTHQGAPPPDYTGPIELNINIQG
ncbi:MAG: hypothetical protein IPH58_05500 [Sphingobacteriales bacterium]|jgi:hypothetical protein|nr:hypothetical protein [Sphingobacteriales bacterium]